MQLPRAPSEPAVASERGGPVSGARDSVSRGRFITLEGIEGAGKSTVARLAVDWLAARGITARVTREPGGTPLAERVRTIVLERGPEAVSPQAETLLMFAARSIHVENLIRPALARGEWIICDRFTDATRAYQGYGRGLDPAWIEQLALAVYGDLQPDCTVLLDLPVALGLTRARGRSGTAADRFEAEVAEFFERVRSGYLHIAQQNPQRVRVIDASRALQDVIDQVTRVLESL
ncbi:MAG: dTMP kinase [Steroidobacteraceae bacterium]